jgi:predicted ATPase
MCHRKFSIDLSPANANFVHGQNGSGKSAILAAIQIQFWGKYPSHTNRLDISGFVSEGSDGRCASSHLNEWRAAMGTNRNIWFYYSGTHHRALQGAITDINCWTIPAKNARALNELGRSLDKLIQMENPWSF